MSLLKKPVTRDMEVIQHQTGKYYFVIREAEIAIYESNLFLDGSVCASHGVKFMDALHEEKPLREGENKFGGES